MQEMITYIRDPETTHIQGIILLMVLILSRLLNSIIASQKNKFFVKF
jgi:hypothetical protein